MLSRLRAIVICLVIPMLACATTPNADQFSSLAQSAFLAIEKSQFTFLPELFVPDEPVIVIGDQRFSDVASVEHYWQALLAEHHVLSAKIHIFPIGELFIQSIDPEYVVLTGEAQLDITSVHQEIEAFRIDYTAVAKFTKNQWKLMMLHATTEREIASLPHSTYRIAMMALLMGLILGAALLVALKRLDSGISDA